MGRVLYIDDAQIWHHSGPYVGRVTTFLPIEGLLKEKFEILYLSSPLYKISKNAQAKYKKVFSDLEEEGLLVDLFWLPRPIRIHGISYLTRIIRFFLFAIGIVVRYFLFHRKFNPDVIIVLKIQCHLGGWLLAKILNKPLISRQYGTFTDVKSLNNFVYPLVRFDEYLSYKLKADHYILTNDGTCLDIVAKHFNLPEDCFTFLANGIDKRNYEILKTRKEILDKLSIDFVNPKILLSISNLEVYKQIHLLINALPKVLLSNSNTILLIIGTGNYEEQLKKIVAELGLEKNVFFLGQVCHDEVNDYFQNSDIFITLSNIGVFGNTTIESMKNGTCVLGYDCIPDGSKLLINHLNTGYLINDICPTTIEDALIVLLSNDELRNNLGKNAQKYIMKNWRSWEEWTQFEMNIIRMLARI